MIIDTTKSLFINFPPSLNGEVLLDTDLSKGYKTASLENCYSMSKLTVQQRIDNGWDIHETLLAGLDFSSLTTVQKLIARKKQKRLEIEFAFKLAEDTTVTYLGVTYSGGRSSAQAINESLMLSEMAVLTMVNVYDVSNTPLTLTIAEAKNLILTIAQASKTNKFNLNAKLKAVESAIDQSELDAVVW